MLVVEKIRKRKELKKTQRNKNKKLILNYRKE